MAGSTTRAFNSLQGLTPDGWHGPVTSTINWCEVDYVWPMLAERFNTMSNVVMVGLAVYSIRQCVKQGLPPRAIAGHLGLVSIGLGSTLFHATLRYTSQLLDEIPMLLSSSVWLFCFFDPPQRRGAALWSSRSLLVAFGLAVWVVGFATSYIRWRHFEMFQTAFAVTQLSVSVGICVLSRRFTDDTAGRARFAEYTRIQVLGHASFILGVVIWAFENAQCDWLQSLHPHFGLFAPLLELHAWWHALTGYGAHCMAVGACHIVVVLRDGPEAWHLERWYGVWSVVRAPTTRLEDEKTALLADDGDE